MAKSRRRRATVDSEAVTSPPPLLAVVLLAFFLSPATPCFAVSPSDPPVSRTVLPMEGDVVVAVQLSDLHFSRFDRSRDADLSSRLPPLLRVARPDLLLITGDLTDAKNERRTSSRQDEVEWAIYRDTIDSIADRSGLDKHRIFDIRGNHDKYGVPHAGHKLDFFSTFSVSASFNRSSTMQSILLQGHNRKIHFLGLDDTLSVGIRYPSNLFAYVTDERIKHVDSELQHWNNDSHAPATIVIFGHFPLSFIYPSSQAKSYGKTFVKHSVSAYVCGHLHAQFSGQLWWLHSAKSKIDNERAPAIKSFWEWELGDWKESRLIRILAIDDGATSFLDFSLQDQFQTKILITYPTDSSNMNNYQSSGKVLRHEISALIFSSQVIVNVTARVFDSYEKFKIVEEIPLHLIPSPSMKPLYHGKWNAESYRSTSPVRYLLQVFAVDSLGQMTRSERRPFSVEGDVGGLKLSWRSYLLIGVQWDDLYKILLWSNICFVLTLLLFPKLLSYAIGRSLLHQRLMLSVISCPVQWRKAHFWLLWFLIEGSRSKVFSFSLIAYVLWLVRMPWLWGHATSEDDDIAPMYLSGWRLSSYSPELYDKFGNPDLIAITLPFLCAVVLPMVLLIYGLFAEKAIEISQHVRGKMPDDSITTSAESVQLVQGSATKRAVSSVMRLQVRRTRRLLLVACLAVTLVHLKRCAFLMSAYGAVPVSLSAAFSWTPPLLLGAAVYSTRTTNN